MDFDFTEEQILARETARKFARVEVAPTVEEDEEALFDISAEEPIATFCSPVLFDCSA